MASAGNSGPTGGDAIQFDRAEFTTAAPGTVECSSCKHPIAGSYYELQGRVVCEPCSRAIDQAFRGGSRSRRFLKAGLFGFAAALGGAIIIGLFRTLTGWDAAIISILAGYMVGSAVRQGSGYRGGRVYQVMAVLLTYSALSWSYLPLITKMVFSERPAAGANAQAARNVPGAKPAAIPKVALPPRNAPNVSLTEALVAVLVVSVVIVVMMYAAPILMIVSEMPGGLIILLIVFWGLQQAWQLTRKVTLDFRGPYRVGERGPSPQGVPAHG